MVPSLSRLLAAFPNLQISILCRKIRNEGSRAGILEYLEVAAPAMHACPRRLTEAADLLKQTSHVTRVPRAVDDGFILKRRRDTEPLALWNCRVPAPFPG